MTATAKAYKGLGMNGIIAQWYAANASKRIDQYIFWADRVAELAQFNQDRFNGDVTQVLEVAPGPGLFSVELAKHGRCRIVGLDISQTFVEIARKNAAAAGVDVDFRRGNASDMPFPANRFDFIFCSAAFKNFSDPVGALREMHRVLKPGGKALIVDLRKDTPVEEIDAFVDKGGEGALSKAMTKMTFRTMLLKRAYSREQLEGLIAQSGFRSSNIETESIGVEVLLTK